MKQNKANQSKSKAKQTKKTTLFYVHSSTYTHAYLYYMVEWLSHAPVSTTITCCDTFESQSTYAFFPLDTSIFSNPAYDFLVNISHLIRIVDLYDFKQTNQKEGILIKCVIRSDQGHRILVNARHHTTQPVYVLQGLSYAGFVSAEALRVLSLRKFFEKSHFSWFLEPVAKSAQARWPVFV